jgi:hypothetical protein
MITVLCVRKDSVYKKLGCDCFDKDRDMTTWSEGNSVIAHPPCAQWGKFTQFATVNDAEKQLAVTCVDLIRRWGGILEHPSASKLFGSILPRPGKIDQWGGYSICINQHWFGHRCEKKTLLYIVGCLQQNLPAVPISFDAVQCVIAQTKTKAGNYRNGKKVLSKAQRDKTPIDLARWLIQVAGMCNENSLSLSGPKRNEQCRDATRQE